MARFAGSRLLMGAAGDTPGKSRIGFSNAGMLSRCEAAEGRPCEMWGAMAYPTCKEGFTPFGGNVCTPVCPSGMTDIGVSCAKQTYIRTAATATCAPGQVYEAGLCYVACRPGYQGVGPVCWGTCPTDKPYPCAAGCATNANTSAQATTDQVLSVLQAVSSIALEAVSLGTSTAVVGGLEAGVKAGTKLGVSAAARSMTTAVTRKTVVDAIQNAAVGAGKSIATTEAETIATALGTYDVQALGQVAAGADPPDFDWTSLDPTGIASIVQAYNHPVCRRTSARHIGSWLLADGRHSASGNFDLIIEFAVAPLSGPGHGHWRYRRRHRMDYLRWTHAGRRLRHFPATTWPRQLDPGAWRSRAHCCWWRPGLGSE